MLRFASSVPLLVHRLVGPPWVHQFRFIHQVLLYISRNLPLFQKRYLFLIFQFQDHQNEAIHSYLYKSRDSLGFWEVSYLLFPDRLFLYESCASQHYFWDVRNLVGILPLAPRDQSWTGHNGQSLQGGKVRYALRQRYQVGRGPDA